MGVIDKPRCWIDEEMDGIVTLSVRFALNRPHFPGKYFVSIEGALTSPSSIASRPFSRRTPSGIIRSHSLLHPLYKLSPTVDVVMMVVMM